MGFIYLILLGAISLIVFLIASMLKFIFRIFFKHAKFLLCLVCALVIVLVAAAMITNKPLVSSKEAVESSVIDEAVDRFSGLYSKQLPLLAWRFEAQELPENSEDYAIIKIDYFPIGSLEIAYNATTKDFRLLKPLELPIFTPQLPAFDKIQAVADSFQDSADEFLGDAQDKINDVAEGTKSWFGDILGKIN